MTSQLFLAVASQRAEDAVTTERANAERIVGEGVQDARDFALESRGHVDVGWGLTLVLGWL